MRGGQTGPTTSREGSGCCTEEPGTNVQIPLDRAELLNLYFSFTSSVCSQFSQILVASIYSHQRTLLKYCDTEEPVPCSHQLMVEVEKLELRVGNRK